MHVVACCSIGSDEKRVYDKLGYIFCDGASPAQPCLSLYSSSSGKGKAFVRHPTSHFAYQNQCDPIVLNTDNSFYRRQDIIALLNQLKREVVATEELIRVRLICLHIMWKLADDEFRSPKSASPSMR